MPRRLRRVLCHECCALLTTDERVHYVYQCHRCVVIEHDLSRLAERDPGHPDLTRPGFGPVEIDRASGVASGRGRG